MSAFQNFNSVTGYAKKQLLNMILGRSNSLNFGNISIGILTGGLTLYDHCKKTLGNQFEPRDEWSNDGRSIIKNKYNNGYRRLPIGVAGEPSSYLFDIQFDTELNKWVLTNTQELKFDVATGDWQGLSIQAWALFAGDGAVLAYGELDNGESGQEFHRLVKTGEVFYIKKGKIRIVL